MKEYVIIVAGGKGLRMGGDVPKQFIPLAGKPVLMRTIERFRQYSKDISVILVLPREQQEYWKELCEEYSFAEDYRIADGGETRFHSVKNGLSLIPDSAEGVVGVHDGVRPFPSVDVIDRCFKTAAKDRAVVPVSPVVDTLRLLGDDGCSETVMRTRYKLVQTPQTFNLQLLRKAYAQDYTDAFTDDASVAEAAGHKITLVDGNRENIKLTTPFDIMVAEAILRNNP